MRRSFKWTLTVSVIVVSAVFFMFSPYFNIMEIEVVGCQNFNEAEIIKKAGLDENTNIFLFNASEANEKIKENLYIEQVLFQKSYPNKLNITVQERFLSGYVEYMEGKYLYIDENGRVLEINSFFVDKLPVVRGLKFNKIRLGEILDAENTAAFKTVVKYARLLKKYQLNELITRIEVSDSANTRVYLYNIDVQLGDETDADEKIRTLKDIIENMPNVENIKGFLDIRVIKSQYIFKFLT